MSQSGDLSIESMDFEKYEAERPAIPGAIETDRRSSISSASARQPGHDIDLEKAETMHSSTGQQPVARIQTAQDWTGPDDPENPLNWSSSKKARHFLPVAFLSMAVTAGSSMVSSANFDLQAYFGISRTAAILPLTLYVVGLGAGPVIAAPLSEQYGRSVVYKITGPVFMLFLVGAGFSKSFGSLLACRLLAGMTGAPVLAIGAGTNADLFQPRDRAFAACIFIMMPFLGPAVGPVIGGFAAQYGGWQWTQWCTILLAVVTYIPCLFMEETYKKVILQKRAKRLNLAPPPGPKVTSLQYWKKMATVTMVRPVAMIFTEPIVLLFGLYNSFTFSVLFAFFAAFPYTYAKEYHFNTWQTGLTFISIGLGVLIAAATAITFDRLIYRKKHDKALVEGIGSLPPEERLYAGMAGAIGLPIGLFWFAWTARSNIHWISPILAGIPFAWGNLALFLSATLFMIDVYGPMNGASAVAANGLMRYTIGACFPLFTVQMYERLGIAWATSLLGFICIAMLPIPYAFYKYGPAIRRKSRYSTTVAYFGNRT